MTFTSSQQLQNRIDAARGIIPCDLLISDITYLDVVSLKWRTGSIGIKDGIIVSTDSEMKAAQVMTGKGGFLVPGFIDAHVHVESSLLVPTSFESAVLPRGTTTAICDPHELANVQGPSGIAYFLQESEKLLLDLRVMLSSCVPATHMETNGGGKLSVSELLPFKAHPKALGLAEMMNVPGVLFKDPDILSKLEAFSDSNLDGHSPLLRGSDLSAYLATGVSTCHESSQFDEAEEKLRKGMKVWIREGSVAKDLATLIPLLNSATSISLGFCTDDRNPLDIAKEGHIDHLVRSAIRFGIPEEIVYRSASWSVANHYGMKKLGMIAPGYQADLVLLDDAKTCAVREVIKSGKRVAEYEYLTGSMQVQNSIRLHIPTQSELEGPTGRVHVIEVIPGKIITGRSVLDSKSSGVAHLTVIERYGHQSPPANAYVRGFGERMQGAIASSVGHDSHNVICVGTNTSDMSTAIAHLQSLGGGFVVCKDGAVLADLALPFGGLMTFESEKEITKKLMELRFASRSIHCEIAEPFLQLAFLSLPVIPSLKLTDQGLVDVDLFKLIDVRAA